MSTDHKINACYSLPRFIAPAIQCSFCNYFWELYTKEFGWSPSEWEVVSRTCTFTQIVFFIIYGVIFSFLIDQDTNGARWWSIGIEAIGTFIHWFTYFLLIMLPIKWHGIDTPFVDSLFGKASNFRQAMFGGPVPLSSMAKSRGWYRFFCIPWCFVKFFWVILYIPMKVCFLCIPISHRKKNVVNITQLPSTMGYESSFTRVLPLLSTLEFIPLERNNFAMRMKRARQFMGTRTFGVYMLAFAHGVGVSAHEFCNNALPHFIYGTDSDGAKRGGAIPMNLSFFFFSNLVIFVIFSLAKFYIRSKAFFSEIFYILAIMFLALHIPLLPAFIVKTEEESTYQHATGGKPSMAACFTLAGLTTFHATTLFWMFSGGPLTFYISFFVLGGDTGIMSFGVLIINAALVGASIANLIVTNTQSYYIGKEALTNKEYVHRIVTGVCILCQTFVFFLFYKHDWSWNKRNWFNYLLLIVTGIVNSIFVGYTNIMMSNLAGSTNGNVKNFKWLFYGIFYGATNIAVTGGMFFMFRSLGQDRMIYCSCKCFRFSYHYCFPVMYKTITIVFIIANIIAALPIWLNAGYPSL